MKKAFLTNAEYIERDTVTVCSLPINAVVGGLYRFALNLYPLRNRQKLGSVFLCKITSLFLSLECHVLKLLPAPA